MRGRALRGKVFSPWKHLGLPQARKWIHLFTAMRPLDPKKRVYLTRTLKIALGGALTGFLAYLFTIHSAEIRRNVVERDSIAYWTAGRLLARHQNPYDAKKVLELERRQGYLADKPLVLRTPPWSLFLFLPLGYLSPFGAWMLWIGISLGSLLVAMRLCWTIYAAGTIPRNVYSLIGYGFAPVPACLVAGQMGVVLLIGLVLFLWLERERPFLAGVALVLPFAKPHLLSLFWFALLFWLVVGRKRTVAVGFGIGLLAATSVALLFDPSIFQHYRVLVKEAAIGYEFIPALSGVLRLLFFRRVFWAQFIPTIIGLVWAARFVNRNRDHWDWRRHSPILLVVSVLTTPYAWLTDEVVLLPAMLQGLAFVYVSRGNIKMTTRLLLFVFASLDGLLLLILRFKIPFSTGIYFWSSLVWFLWYVFARRCSEVRVGAPHIEE
jgi:hypothetical protein